MAMIDYGAVVFKNGRKISNEMFMDMIEAVGWSDVSRKRYPECTHTDEDGWSVCDGCDKANYRNYSDERGEWKAFYSDCHGERLCCSDHIDGNFFAYIGDKHVTACFYKCSCVIYEDGAEVVHIWDCDGRMSVRGEVGVRQDEHGWEICDGVYHIKRIGRGVYHFSMQYKGDSYHVLYGYGIDNNADVWKRVKIRYLGKKVSEKIDRLYKHLGWPEACGKKRQTAAKICLL